MICTNRYTMEPIKNLADVGIEPNVKFLPSGYEPDEIDLFSNSAINQSSILNLWKE